VIHFTNSKPSAYDSLGEIGWHLENPSCANCGALSESDVNLVAQYYDGCHWQNPACSKCGNWIEGSLPDNAQEAEIILSLRERGATIKEAAKP
jgi:ribosomal protein S27AE